VAVALKVSGRGGRFASASAFAEAERAAPGAPAGGSSDPRTARAGFRGADDAFPVPAGVLGGVAATTSGCVVGSCPAGAGEVAGATASGVVTMAEAALAAAAAGEAGAGTDVVDEGCGPAAEADGGCGLSPSAEGDC
jgi:hypothetical protein